MADEVKTLDSLTLPPTQPYRVKIVAVSYNEFVATYDSAGQPVVVPRWAFGTRGQVLDLTAGEARRLEELDAVAPADSPKGYQEMDDDELRAAAKSRGVVVRSSGADMNQPRREDYVTALQGFDSGSDAGVLTGGMVGVGTVPGGVAVASNTGEAPLAAFDAREKPVGELIAWLTDNKPNANQTVDAANGDPAAAQALIEAETTATHDDPRATVVGRLEKIADQGGGGGGGGGGRGGGQ